MTASLPGSIGVDISNALRAITADSWSASRNEVIAYRDAALSAQQYKCAYCQRKIIRNELGHRELDHILPKSQAPKTGLDGVTASSNIESSRRHTRGYSNFRHEPRNLVITCKRCNAFKGSYDCLSDRSAPPINYPENANDFEWIHPYHDDYYAHLKIEGDVLFQPVDGSKKGQAVITACGLNKIEELIERVIADHVAEAVDIGLAMMQVIFSENIFDPEKTAQKIVTIHGKGSVLLVADCLVDLQASMMMGTPQMLQVLNNFFDNLNRSTAVAP